MSLAFDALLVGLGFLGGLLSGLLGIGGGLVLIPLLLYVPEWLGFGAVDIRSAAAITVVQVAASTLSGAVAHGRHGLVHRRLAIVMSVATVAGSLTGGVVSAYVPSILLLVVTALLATGAALLMATSPPAENVQGPSHPGFNPALAAGTGSIIGLLIGMNGAGAFLMVPTLIYLLRIPTRSALATVLAIGFPTALGALAGKLATGQIPFVAAAMVVLGAVPAAQIGSAISVRAPARVLRFLYGALVLVIAVGLWYDVLHAAT